MMQGDRTLASVWSAFGLHAKSFRDPLQPLKRRDKGHLQLFELCPVGYAEASEADQQPNADRVRDDGSMLRKPHRKNQVADGSEAADQEKCAEPLGETRIIFDGVVRKPRNAQGQKERANHIVRVHASEREVHEISDVITMELLTLDSETNVCLSGSKFLVDCIRLSRNRQRTDVCQRIVVERKNPLAKCCHSETAHHTIKPLPH
mmetsp:Transcript_30128/g.80393  ORF Transcript_30128/g.80393 Transcript_30128/m.80393 type:complete len:205 (+) Transcript_30128:2536-3150(+)